MKKSEVIEKLSNGVVDIQFTKVSGATRLMKATLNDNSIAYQNISEVVNTKKNPDNVQPVWDVDASGWRSFRWSSVTEVDGVTVSGVDL